MLIFELYFQSMDIYVTMIYIIEIVLYMLKECHLEEWQAFHYMLPNLTRRKKKACVA